MIETSGGVAAPAAVTPKGRISARSRTARCTEFPCLAILQQLVACEKARGTMQFGTHDRLAPRCQAIVLNAGLSAGKLAGRCGGQSPFSSAEGKIVIERLGFGGPHVGVGLQIKNGIELGPGPPAFRAAKIYIVFDRIGLRSADVRICFQIERTANPVRSRKSSDHHSRSCPEGDSFAYRFADSEQWVASPVSYLPRQGKRRYQAGRLAMHSARGIRHETGIPPRRRSRAILLRCRCMPDVHPHLRRSHRQGPTAPRGGRWCPRFPCR